MTDLSDFIQQVKRSNDIVDVIGSYLELKQRGTTLFARCPFHGEKTASFSVNRNMQIYHCFGCGESGDVIKFVEKYESCTFMEALEILAKRAGLKMPETEAQKLDKSLEEKRKKRTSILQYARTPPCSITKTSTHLRGKLLANTCKNVVSMQKRSKSLA